MKGDFYVGSTFTYGGVSYRVLAGRYCDGDMIIEFSTDSGQTWHRPHIAHTLILAEFKYYVEENNYPRSDRWKGGQYLLDAITRATADGTGWQAEAERIARQRAAKFQREEEREALWQLRLREAA